MGQIASSLSLPRKSNLNVGNKLGGLPPSCKSNQPTASSTPVRSLPISMQSKTKNSHITTSLAHTSHCMGQEPRAAHPVRHHLTARPSKKPKCLELPPTSMRSYCLTLPVKWKKTLLLKSQDSSNFFRKIDDSKDLGSTQRLTR